MKKFATILFTLAVSILAYADVDSYTINLSGTWNFQLDPNKKLSPRSKFTDTINLPSTTDVAKKGNYNPLVIGSAENEVFDGWNIIAGLDDDKKSAKPKPKQSSIFHLSREYSYEGLAWYSKEINIPKHWENKTIFLNLERTKFSNIFVDGRKKGSSDILSAPQKFNLGKLSAGKHLLSISIDNTKKIWGFNSHMLGEPSTNWNGIIGNISLEAKHDVYILSMKAVGDVKSKNFNVELVLQGSLPNITQRKQVELILEAKPQTSHCNNLKNSTKLTTSKSVYNFEISNAGNVKKFDLPVENPLLWDEYNPVYYNVIAKLKFDDNEQIVTIDSGFRDIKANGHQLSINGKTIFLRGKHDAMVFPLIGHPPTTLDEWLAYFKTCKDYGINHIRYHTSCPTPMAFKAANILGIYLSVDGVAWKSFPDILTSKEMYVLRDSIELLDAYSSNPSFVMFNLGNETQGSRKNLSLIRDMLRTRAKHILFSTGANSQLRTQHQADGDDYWVTFRTYQEPTNTDTSGNTRGSCSYVNLPLGEVQTGSAGGTMGDFSKSLKYSTVPVIGHETGQYLFYPNFDEIVKYTGVQKPYVIEIFKQRLKDANLLDNWHNYYLSAGKLAMLCYKRDIELALGTKNFAGFQLLDLQDFPDQAWAIVGPLDVFMQPKPDLVTPTYWQEFCSEVVPLAKLKKYCYNVGESFNLRVDVAQFSQNDINDALIDVDILKNGEDIVYNKKINVDNIKRGALSEKLVDIEIDTSKFEAPSRYEIQLKVKQSNKLLGKNNYNIWLYPNENVTEYSKSVNIVEKDIENALKLAKSGKNVLFFVDLKANEKSTIKGSFSSIFWTWAIFESVARKAGMQPEAGTMGILVDEKHSAFESFPTSYHSDWQWFNLINNSRVMDLDNLKNKKNVNIVEMIDNIWRRKFLSLAFEANIGDGKIFVTSIPLNNLYKKYPEAKQLLSSLINYVSSGDFKPKQNLTEDEILKIFDDSIKD